MAAKFLLTAGIGWNRGKPLYIVTRGLSMPAAVPYRQATLQGRADTTAGLAGRRDTAPTVRGS